MPRTVTLLNGEEKSSSQFPFNAVFIDIPDLPVAITDIDETIYLKRSTGEASFTVGSGMTAFFPEPSLTTPSIQWANDPMLTDMTLDLSNVNEFWTSVLMAGEYREAPVEVWQGNVVLEVGDRPEEATLTGAVLVYSGLVDRITTDVAKASITVVPSYISPQTMTIPHRFFTSESFKFLPAPNKKLHWGSTEVSL